MHPALPAVEVPLNSNADVPGLVSIVMPAYNAAEVIGEAITSVLAQTYSHWELLITDDGSTDATASVVRSFDDPRIKLIQQCNQGVSEARNRSLDIASGEFITFLDADDALPPRSLESRVTMLEQNQDVDIVNGVFVVCGPELSTYVKARYPGPYGPLLPRLLKLDERVFCNACFLFKRTLLGELRFQSGMSHAEDLLFFIELAAIHRPCFAPVGDTTYLYRTGTGSAMTNLDGLQQGYFQMLRQLRCIPQLSWSECLVSHLRIARILLATWLRQKHPIRGLSAASRALVIALPRA